MIRVHLEGNSGGNRFLADGKGGNSKDPSEICKQVLCTISYARFLIKYSWFKFKKKKTGVMSLMNNNKFVACFALKLTCNFLLQTVIHLHMSIHYSDCGIDNFKSPQAKLEPCPLQG